MKKLGTLATLGLGVLGGALMMGCSSSDTDTETPPVADTTEEAKSQVERDASPSVDEADYAAFISGTNDFGFDLYRKIASKPGNVFYSPLSTTSALAMTYAGARGKTAEQMASVLHSTLAPKTFHASMNRLLLDLSSRNIAEHDTQEGKKSVKVLPVNQAWQQKGYNLNSDYLDTLALNYGAGVKLLDFQTQTEKSRGIINGWVEKNTFGRIVDLIPQGQLDASTRLVLTNAMYFYGSWGTSFDAKNTVEGDFHGTGGVTKAQFMTEIIPGGYAEGNGFRAATLSYDGSKLSMMVILPDEGKMAEVRDGLSSEKLATMRTSMKAAPAQVQWALPKFKFTWGTDSFKEELIALGMKDAFDAGSADFSGMTSNRELFIGDVLHKAFVGIDESGTEAAAATAVIMKYSSVPQDPKPFKVDRPFLFLIQDETGAVMFVGQVEQI